MPRRRRHFSRILRRQNLPSQCTDGAPQRRDAGFARAIRGDLFADYRLDGAIDGCCARVGRWVGIAPAASREHYGKYQPSHQNRDLVHCIPLKLVLVYLLNHQK